MQTTGIKVDSQQMREMQAPCKGCIYHSNVCNYLFDTGHRRPCPPGKACTVKTTRNQKRPRKGITINDKGEHEIGPEERKVLQKTEGRGLEPGSCGI